MNSTTGTSLGAVKNTARLAGLLYLAHFVAFFLADNGVHYTAVGPLDGAVTANNMMASEWQFRAGYVSFILAALFFLLAAWALYVVMKPVNRDLALLFLLLNLAGVVVQCASLFFEWGAQVSLSDAAFLGVFSQGQRESLAVLFLTVYKTGFMIAQIFLALWVLPLGYLIIKSGFLPRILGIFLLIDCLVLLIWVFQFFLFYPGNETLGAACLAISFITEAALCLWLLMKGVDVEQWENRALVTA
ncbi:MAG: DUF4386 domain-containing protein [Candidatus Promineifilaceae bacterium]